MSFVAGGAGMTMRGALREGMTAYTSDGARLGRVLQLHPGHFVIERGTLFPCELPCRYEEVRSVQGDELWLDSTRAQLSSGVAGGLDGDRAGQRPA
jgi:hypothetical protein